MTEKPFDENMDESRKVEELKKDGLYLNDSFILTSIIEKGWINASFLQGLKHNKWVVIPSNVQNGHSKLEDGSEEEVSQKPPGYAAVAHVQMQVHL